MAAAKGKGSGERTTAKALTVLWMCPLNGNKYVIMNQSRSLSVSLPERELTVCSHTLRMRNIRGRCVTIALIRRQAELVKYLSHIYGTYATL